MDSPTERMGQLCKAALELEHNGKKFYDRASASCKNKLGRDIFKMLAQDEIVHMERFRSIYISILAGRGWSDEWRELKLAHRDVDKLFQEMASRHSRKIKAAPSDLEALDVGIDLERRSIAFYEGHLADAADAALREFLERLIVEERSHHRALSDMKFYLSDPAAWYQEREHGGLDGA